MSYSWSQSRVPVGVGLRHVHYHDALIHPAKLDFVEVHAENFFACGGASIEVLKDVAEHYPLSIHGTSMGLGSDAGIPDHFLNKFAHLIEWTKPVLVSEHAAFTWGELDHQIRHAGDLLPIKFDDDSLTTLAENVSRVQDKIGRQLLVENLSAYITPEGNTLEETEFLSALVDKTGCRLLIDINNLAVNAFNANSGNIASRSDILTSIENWLKRISYDAVGEIHLAGCTPAPAGGIMIDDHSRQVSEIVWEAYRTALNQFGSVPTLIEWDTDLPEWQVLLDEADKARAIASELFSENTQNQKAQSVAL
ncbi:DUF692 domain-containing protein [Parendozoicomonas sp. Alg238-R29]|uniref:DUF692 domain-containing protein n=1 Tax=Parendozoicomonas sp. Alg238-R29 TaxID=2993446 RepID=UPI00248D481C|nr:DUF692 domain-containing protein [Parendozoicomonas sp. Alg238-R29]